MSHEAWVQFVVQCVSWWNFQPTDDNFRIFWDKQLGNKCKLKCFTYFQLGPGKNQLEYEFKLEGIKDEKELIDLIEKAKHVWGEKTYIHTLHLLL